jgi:hypothetical protein
MSYRHSFFGAAAFAAASLISASAFAQSGPCTDDIAKLSRSLGTQVGLGAPVSEPAYGQRTGPNDTKDGQKQAGSTTGSVGSAETDRSQPGGAGLQSGGSPGTVGGVAGPAGAATGKGQGDAVAGGQIATSPEDVRRQSENRPTTAAAAAQGEAAGSHEASEDKVSRAKMALQRAVDLNAKGDKSCADAVKEAQNLVPQQGR